MKSLRTEQEEVGTPRRAKSFQSIKHLLWHGNTEALIV
jgi:hypothetical protein